MQTPTFTTRHSGKNRRFFGDVPKNRDFFWLPIFRPEKIAIFSKNQTSRKIGKHRQTSAKIGKKLGKNWKKSGKNREKSRKIGKNWQIGEKSVRKF